MSPEQADEDFRGAVKRILDSHFAKDLSSLTPGEYSTAVTHITDSLLAEVLKISLRTPEEEK